MASASILVPPAAAEAHYSGSSQIKPLELAFAGGRPLACTAAASAATAWLRLGLLLEGISCVVDWQNIRKFANFSILII